MIVRAPGFQTVTTHIFDEDSDYLDSDTVFAVKRSLLRNFELRAADDPQRPDGVEGGLVLARMRPGAHARRRPRGASGPRAHGVTIFHMRRAR